MKAFRRFLRRIIKFLQNVLQYMLACDPENMSESESIPKRIESNAGILYRRKKFQKNNLKLRGGVRGRILVSSTSISLLVPKFDGTRQGFRF